MIKKYLNFMVGLKKFLDGRIEPDLALELARKMLLERITQREANFLSLFEEGVFGYAKSPYIKLLTSKKITIKDIKKWVAQSGIEKTLSELQSQGVYFTIEEFKGKKDVVRNGLSFRVNEKDFDNPFLSTAYEVRSSGTRSSGTRVSVDFNYLVQRSFYDAFILNMHDALTSPIANWFPIFPGAPGINSSLRFARIGNPPKKWFSQVDINKLKLDWKRRWGTNYIVYMSRFMGVPLAKSQFVDLNNAFTVAKWASDALEHNPNCVVYTFASSAVRVCMSAKENNLNIKGTRFLVTGEPLSVQKKKEIEATGALAIPVYGVSEAGVVAAGCNHHYSSSDHCHTLKDTIAVINYKRAIPYTDTAVDALLFSSLLYEAPKILLNVEMGDSGVVETKPCSCEFGQMGFDSHISQISSYEKLTGEGVTFVDTDFVRVIEEDLPKLFGGESTDYQLIEEEDSKSLTYLSLYVSPRVGTINEKAVVSTFIDRLKNAEDRLWAETGPEMWKQAGLIRIKRENPVPTVRGKILPFHIVKKVQSLL